MKKLLIIISCLSLIACGRPKPHGQQHGRDEQRIVKITTSGFDQTLYFSGTIKPLSLASVTTPYDSVIKEKKVNFGQTVKSGEHLFTIESPQLEKEYDQSLSSYLKAKDDLSMATTKFSGTQDLYQLGLISKNEYLSQESNLSNLKIALIQKERDLEEMFSKIGRTDVDLIKKLKISDTEGVSKALEDKLGQIPIYAPASGVFLEPPKTTGDNDKTLEIGSDVKQGSPLGLIGNMDGVTISIKISEIDLQKITPGLKAVITSIAFPSEELKGEIVRINSQASSTGGAMGALPTFAGEVLVPKLTAAQKKLIKVGMTAKVEVKIKQEASIRVPLNAVFQDQGKLFIKVRVNGKFQSVPVITGPASADRVIIKEGLKDGDEILVPGQVEERRPRNPR